MKDQIKFVEMVARMDGKIGPTRRKGSEGRAG